MTRVHTKPYHKGQRLFFATLSLFLILFGLYVYFISASVVQVIARKEVDREIAQVTSHTGDLESRYITAKQAIASSTISRYGFATTSSSKIYVQKASTNLVLLAHDAN